MDHSFTHTIKNILNQNFWDNWAEIYEKSELIQYLNNKTRSANSWSKSRGSFANLYAIFGEKRW